MIMSFFIDYTFDNKVPRQTKESQTLEWSNAKVSNVGVGQTQEWFKLRRFIEAMMTPTFKHFDV